MGYINSGHPPRVRPSIGTGAMLLYFKAAINLLGTGEGIILFPQSGDSNKFLGLVFQENFNMPMCPPTHTHSFNSPLFLPAFTPGADHSTSPLPRPCSGRGLSYQPHLRLLNPQIKDAHSACHFTAFVTQLLGTDTSHLEMCALTKPPSPSLLHPKLSGLSSQTLPDISGSPATAELQPGPRSYMIAACFSSQSLAKKPLSFPPAPSAFSS